jgi:cyclic beta-1,2-glucan synthetase
LLEGLEIRYLGNRDPNLFFALLTDFRDAPEPSQPDDAELLRLARDGIQSLNARYSPEGVTVFHLFHRPRVWNPHERLWMGYERKRGKLEQFNALLRGGPRDPFPRSSAIWRSSPPSATSSRWTPIPVCRAMPPANSSARWRIR